MTFLRVFLFAMLAFAGVVTYAALQWRWGEGRDRRARAEAQAARPQRAGVSRPPEFLAAAVPESDEDVEVAAAEEAEQAQVARERVVSAGPLPVDGHGAEASRRERDDVAEHPRSAQGYARLAVAAWQAAEARGPSPREVAPRMLGGGPTGAGTERGADRRWWGDRQPPRAGERIVSDSSVPPHVEVLDETGRAHRLFLDRNGHLHYRAPAGAQVAIDDLHEVGAFNLAVDLRGDVHTAWYEGDTGQLHYARVAAGGAVAFRAVIGRPAEPDEIGFLLSESEIRVRYGRDGSSEHVVIDATDPSVRSFGY